MELLVADNRVEEMIFQKPQKRFPQPQDPMHERFCCRKELVVCSDENDDEIVVLIEQVHADRTKGITRTFHQVRIGPAIYRQRIP
jgi:hypothetical protein